MLFMKFPFTPVIRMHSTSPTLLYGIKYYNNNSGLYLTRHAPMPLPTNSTPTTSTQAMNHRLKKKKKNSPLFLSLYARYT